MARRGRIISLMAVLAILSPAASVYAADDGDGSDAPMLRIPGLPPIPMPPNSHVYGPDGGAPDVHAPQAATPNDRLYHEYGTVTPGGGAPGGAGGRALGSGGGGHHYSDIDPYGGMVVGPGGAMPAFPTKRAAAPPKKKPPTPEERQAQIRRALMPKPAMAVSKRSALDDLYAKLAAAKDEDESKGLASLIAAVWLRSGSATADLLMSRAQKAIEDKKYPLAIKVLDSVVDLEPGWAEAWNKRASARYLAGDLNGAMADVDHVLKLDPNHFAALSGMAMILQRTGLDKRALQIYRRELSVYPHQPELEKMVEKLTLEVEGQGI